MFESIIIISTLFILLLIFSLFYFLKLYEKKSMAYISQVQEIKNVYEQNLLTTQIEIQEQTFENISREIHDNIGQKLSLAKLYLNLANLNGNAAADQVHQSVHLISEVINDLSHISRSLSSEMIQSDGLVKAMEFEIMQLQKTGTYQIEFSVTGNHIFFDTSKELIVFRIFQEAVNNIIKHSNCSGIFINMDFNNSELKLSIKDNGNGYDQPSHNGAGLKNMAKRANMLGGQLQVKSKINEGTLIHLELPI